jgi:hypothetical protein
MFQLSIDEKKLRLGKMGEICVGNWASTHGKVVIHSIDPFDRQKDLVIDGKKVEVKTQIPYIIENSFTISPYHLHKCRYVDELYFVALPSPNPRFSYDGQGWIYHVDPKLFTYREVVKRNDERVFLIDMKQSAVIRVKEIDQGDIDQMMKYSVGV